MFCVALLISLFAAFGVSAAVYEPDNHGTYTVSLDMQPESEYIMLVVKGHYDQTNYIEAYLGAADADVLYYEQKASDENGNVSFGPFVPNGYYDATVIVGGTNLGIPYLAGYLSVEGISNCADISVLGVEQTYVVAGYDGFDCSVTLDAQVFDTFGYPSVTGEEVSFELLNNLEGVTLEGNVLNISRFAKPQAFIIRASAGEARKNVFVQVERETPIHYSVSAYADEECSESIDTVYVKGVIGEFEPITIYAKTLDQFGEEIEDTHTFSYGGKTVSQTFTPYLGMSPLEIRSNNAFVYTYVTIVAEARPDYQGTANDLFVFINSCKEKLDEEKNISINGKDVYPEETWTTQSDVDSFALAIATAKEALDLYGLEGYGDDDYADELKALSNALADYEESFETGTRKDVTSISINEENLILTTASSLEITTTTSPKIGTTTDVLTWTSSDDSVATVTAGTGGKATVKGVASGKAIITVTTKTGLSDSVEVTVIKKATSVTLTSNVSGTTPVATYGSDPVILKAQIKPTGCTDIITWTVANPDILDLSYNEYIDDDGFKWIEATVIPKSAGTTKVTISAQYGEKSAYKNVKVEMPAWETATAPVADVESGSILPGTVVSLKADEGTSIYYTLDGTTPSKANGRLYTVPFAINQSLTLKAVAVGKELYDSEVVTYEYLAVNTGVSVPSVVAKPGEAVNVRIDAVGFENVDRAEMKLVVSPAESMISYESDYDVTVEQVSDQPEAYKITYVKSDKELSDGNLLTIKFSVKSDVQEGSYSYGIEQSDIYSAEFPIYSAATNSGTFRVVDYRVGDVNNDGVIGLADVMLLKQYLAGNENANKTLIAKAADTDGDGDIDNDDVTLLSKYCVGWSVTLG